uniref:FYN binding protein 1 n=1 Tax=Pseudonaja textilis TaxID=8673 RepID=A0A670YLE0_PSETE
MAKFNNNAAEDVHCHQVRSGGHPTLAKKAAFEKFAQLENAGLSSKPNSLYKPTSLKSPPSTKPLHDASGKDFKGPPLQSSPVASKVKMLAEAASREANEKTTYPKPLVPKISEGLREETKPVFPKIPEKKLPGSPPQKSEIKPLDQRWFKPEPQGSEAKPVFPTVAGVKEKFNSAAQENNSKPPFPKPPVKHKPSQGFTHSEDVSNKSACFNQVSPNSSGLKSKAGSIQPLKDPQDKSRNETNPINPFPPLKHVNHQNNLPQIPPKPVGQQNEEAKPKPIKNIFLQNKQEESGSASGAIGAILANSSRTVTTGPWANNTGKEEKDKDKNLPRRKTLPSTMILGPAPQKPNRPPTVDLQKFRKSHGEVFSFLLCRFKPQEEGKKKEKEEKKKFDQKKEQRDKDKKEQELRKKFKLEGPIEVIHQARASTDFKGGKYDLSFKQGDLIEILRVTDNPEGKWLGRFKGSYGYIKTTMVAIDYDTLKRKPRPPMHVQSKHPDSDQEVYDDVGDQDSISRYVTDLSVSQDEEKSDTWSKGLLKILKGKDYQKKSMRKAASKVNTAVKSNTRKPDLPTRLHFIQLYTKSKVSFQLMFNFSLQIIILFPQYEGDIRVLYTTTISKAPSPKKRGSKDLQVKPGELVEVIQEVDDTKVLCRNEEGKCNSYCCFSIETNLLMVKINTSFLKRKIGFREYSSISGGKGWVYMLH